MLSRSQFATLKRGANLKYQPYVFSELPSRDGLVATVRQAAGGRSTAAGAGS